MLNEKITKEEVVKAQGIVHTYITKMRNISSSETCWMDMTTNSYNHSDNNTNVDIARNDYRINTVHNLIMLIIIVLGVTGNVLTIIVLARPRNRKCSTAILYVCLAVSDLAIIFTDILLVVMYNFFNISIEDIQNVCNVSVLLHFTSVESSSWIVVIITLERVVSVLAPFRAKYLCRRRNTLLMLLVVMVLIICSNVVILFEIDGQCNSALDLLSTYSYKKHTLTGQLIPAFIIVFGNIVIIRKVRSSPIVRGNFREGDIVVTRTLVLVSAAFLVTQVPIVCYLYLWMLDRACFIFDLYISLSYLSDFNAAINFLLYMLQGSRFRSEVKRLFVCRTVDTSPDAGSQSITGVFRQLFKARYSTSVINIIEYIEKTFDNKNQLLCAMSNSNIIKANRGK